MTCDKKTLSIKQCRFIINNKRREECRCYYCKECQGHHVTKTIQKNNNSIKLRYNKKHLMKAI